MPGCGSWGYLVSFGPNLRAFLAYAENSGGPIEEYLHWRWNFWIQLGFGCFVQVVHLFGAKETRATKMLDQEAKKRRKLGENIWGPNEVRSFKERFSIKEILQTMWRPYHSKELLVKMRCQCTDNLLQCSCLSPLSSSCLYSLGLLTPLSSPSSNLTATFSHSGTLLKRNLDLR